MQKWKSELMTLFERQVEELLLENKQQAMTIAALRTRVNSLAPSSYKLAAISQPTYSFASIG